MQLVPHAASILLILSVLISPARAQEEEDSKSTEFSSDILFYGDTDRVLVISPQVGIQHALDEEGSEISARATVDAITAASVDVVSNATYRFSEVRTEVNLAARKRIGSALPGFSYRGSYEPDYLSHGLTASWQRDLAEGDANIAASYSAVFDTISRSGTSKEQFSESLHTHVLDWSGTQTVDEKTIVRLAYSFTGQFGYMEKPYRSVPLFDSAGLADAAASGIALSLGTFDRYRLSTKPSEEVPDSRYRHALAARGIRYLSGIESSLRLDYRFYADSWGIFAHTMEGALYKEFSSSFRGYTWMRMHRQSSASFWKKIYTVDSAGSVPALRTTDRSLSRSTHGTLGLRGEYEGDAFSGYVEVSSMASFFSDFLYLDSRFALIVQGGLRWAF